jgi:hypothetical protein
MNVHTPAVIDSTTQKEVFLRDWQQPVVSVPLAQAFPELNEVKEFRNKSCLFNHDRSKLFDVVSNRYSLVSHVEATDTIGETLLHFFGAEISPRIDSWNNGARLSATYKLPIPGIQVAVGDISEVSITMFNSYDRSMPFGANLTAMRLVCSNGMKAPRSFGSISAKHIGSNTASLMLEQLESMVNNVGNLQHVWMKWIEETVTFDQVKALMETGIGVYLPKKCTDLFMKEEMYPMTKWDLYNHLTWYATHQTKTTQRRTELDSLVSTLAYNNL